MSARYCYAVWLRHLVTLAHHGIERPGEVAELGPGRSLGVGMAAVLSGTHRYTGLDAFRLRERDTAIATELTDLYAASTDIPGDAEFPQMQPQLPSYVYPSELIAFDPARVRWPEAIAYHAPWMTVAPRGTADLAISQATMLVVDQPARAYARLADWLRPGGVMSHALNFSSVGLTEDWAAHWTLGRDEWRAKEGDVPYRYNRLPHSAHLALIRAAGCDIVADITEPTPSHVTRRDLHRDFADLTDDDLRIRRAVVIARKRH